ncbi:alpha/beta hydrolase [Aeromicrobium sp.]|uniref:alpha/beta hydrolase n=1 Tax=Aeromicrobium sp. TaxID=1871063 RepID=UPI0030BCF041
MLARISLGMAVLMVGVLALAFGVSRGSESRLPVATGEAGPAGLSRFYQQKVTWERCPPGYCTWVRVPLDYRSPQGTSIKLRVKIRLSGSDAQSPKLFVNPGGPGGSGVEYVDVVSPQLTKRVRAAYDLVGFDPRGIGQSAPVNCLPGPQLATLLDLDPDPDTPKEIDRLDRAFAGLGNGCLKRSGEVASHVSTSNVVRDLDVLRAVMGQETLNYYGASYGTLIGAGYADRHPRRVGRVVLDGALDPTLTKERAGLKQAKGQQNALRSYIKDCVKKPGCPLGDDADGAQDQLIALIDSLEDKPLKVAGKRKLTEAGALYGILASLYDRASWPALSAGIKRAVYGDGTFLLALADRFFRRGADGTIKNDLFEVGHAVRCLDDARTPSSERMSTLADSYEDVSPVFGRMVAWSTQECADWPLESVGLDRSLSATGAAPILIIGSTRDPATPYSGSKELASQLASGRLITRKGDGHTGYRVGNRCVDRAVDRYLLIEPPTGDLSCKDEPDKSEER